jgi:hypothetical protein
MKTTTELLKGLYELLEVPTADYNVWRLRPSQLSQGVMYNIFSAYHHLLELPAESVDDGLSCGVARIVCGHIWEHRYFELYPDLTPHVSLEYKTPDFTISGTCDFIHTDEETGEITIIDTKCITDKVFNMFRYEPDENHHYVRQVRYYIEMLRTTLPKGADINGSLALLSRHFLNVSPENHYCFSAFTPEQWQEELDVVKKIADRAQLLMDSKNNAELLMDKFDKAVAAVVSNKVFLEPYAAYTPWGKTLFNWLKGKPTSVKPQNLKKYQMVLEQAMYTSKAQYAIN